MNLINYYKCLLSDPKVVKEPALEVLHPSSEMHQKVQELARNLNLLSETNKSDEFKKYFQWRADDNYSENDVLYVKKTDTIFHALMRSNPTKNKIIIKLIKIAFQNFKPEGRDCLIAKTRDDDKYFWQMTTNQNTEKFFEHVINASLSQYLDKNPQENPDKKILEILTSQVQPVLPVTVTPSLTTAVTAPTTVGNQGSLTQIQPSRTEGTKEIKKAQTETKALPSTAKSLSSSSQTLATKPVRKKTSAKTKRKKRTPALNKRPEKKLKVENPTIDQSKPG